MVFFSYYFFVVLCILSGYPLQLFSRLAWPPPPPTLFFFSIRDPPHCGSPGSRQFPFWHLPSVLPFFLRPKVGLPPPWQKCFVLYRKNCRFSPALSLLVLFVSRLFVYMPMSFFCLSLSLFTFGALILLNWFPFGLHPTFLP